MQTKKEKNGNSCTMKGTSPALLNEEMQESSHARSGKRGHT
jgi:hypothetical protein